MSAATSGENVVQMLGVSEIVRAVSQATGISVRAIMSRRRRRDVAQARMLCMYLARLLTPLSSPAIGECMGRDHSTILSGAREIRYLRQRAQNFGDVRYRGLDGIAATLIERLSNRAQVLRGPGRAVPPHPVPIPRRAASS